MKQRREVRTRDLAIYFWLQLSLLIIFWATFGVVVGLNLLPEVPVWAKLIIVIGLSYAPLRFLAVGCVLMYKAFAPMSVRDECRFNPSCSTYMVLSINKYGLIVGIIKGLRRITRCKPPNGGDDWP